MGLDVTVLRSLTKVAAWHSDRFDTPNFHQAADGLENGVYHFCETMGFCAGSYSSYNSWRSDLAIFAGDESDVDCRRNFWPSPFSELINFSDCEGLIGPKTAAKLAADFAAYQSKADSYIPRDGNVENWRRQYALWREAFEMAADGGAIQFH